MRRCRRYSKRPGSRARGPRSPATRRSRATQFRSTVDDLKRIAIVALGVNLLLLVVFLRSIVAPLVLLGDQRPRACGDARSDHVRLPGPAGLRRGDLLRSVRRGRSARLARFRLQRLRRGRVWEEARRRPLREAVAIAMPGRAKRSRSPVSRSPGASQPWRSSSFVVSRTGLRASGRRPSRRVPGQVLARAVADRVDRAADLVASPDPSAAPTSRRAAAGRLRAAAGRLARR